MGRALPQIANTFSLVIQITPLLPSSNLLIHPWYPHQLPLTPHHRPASACHVLGVKGFPTYRSSEWNPTISCPEHNQSLGRQRWIGASATPYLPGEAPALPKGCCHWQIMEVIPGGVSRSSLSPLEGSYHNEMEGNSFLFRNNGHNVEQHVWRKDPRWRKAHYDEL